MFEEMTLTIRIPPVWIATWLDLEDEITARIEQDSDASRQCDQQAELNTSIAELVIDTYKELSDVPIDPWKAIQEIKDFAKAHHISTSPSAPAESPEASPPLQES